jgi:putative ABC transport system permease protein
MRALTRDIRFGLRLLFKHPSFAFVALLTLTLAIGVTTAVFSVVNGVLLRPLPFPRADRLVRLFENNVQRGWARFSVAPANFVEWARDDAALSSMTAFQLTTSVLRGPDQSETVRTIRASAEYFDVIARPAALGRVFQRGDDEPAATTNRAGRLSP